MIPNVLKLDFDHRPMNVFDQRPYVTEQSRERALELIVLSRSSMRSADTVREHEPECRASSAHVPRFNESRMTRLHCPPAPHTLSRETAGELS